MEDALLVEQLSSGIFRRFQCVQHWLATARSKVKPEKESVQVDDTKIAELDDQIRKTRYRKGLEVKMAKDEEAHEKELLQDLEQLEWQTRRYSGTGIALVKGKKRRVSEELEVEVTID